jgi:hypothetical protein
MKLSVLLALLPLALAAPAPVIVPRAGAPIPGRYIVKMKNQNLQQLIDTALKLLKKDPAHVYGFGNFGGFAADMSDDIVQLIRNLPGVRDYRPSEDQLLILNRLNTLSRTPL